jgi:hypothetical protein
MNLWITKQTQEILGCRNFAVSLWVSNIYVYGFSYSAGFMGFMSLWILEHFFSLRFVSVCVAFPFSVCVNGC